MNGELATATTERQKVLELQRQVALDLFNLIDTTPVAAILVDTSGRIKLLTPKIQEWFALADTDIGRPLTDIAGLLGDVDLARDVRAAITSGGTVECELRGRTGGLYLRSAMARRSEMGAIQGAVVTYTDVAQLERSGPHSAAVDVYSGLIDSLENEPVVVLDAGLRIISANAAFCSKFALPHEQIGKAELGVLGRPLPAWPLLRERIMEMFGQPSAETAMLELEEQIPERRVWSVQLQRVGSLPLSPALVVLTMRDVTYKNRIDRRQMQFLLDALPVASCVVDYRGRIGFVSAAMQSLLGYGAGELLDQPFSILVPPEWRERYWDAYEKVLERLLQGRMEPGLNCRGLRKDGTRIPVDVGLSLLALVEGPMVVAIIHDLREIKKTEAERDRLRVALAEELDDMRELHELATRLVENAELPAVLDEILGAVIKLQNADFGHIQLYDPEKGILTIAAQKNFPPFFLEYFGQVSTHDDSACARALREGNRVIIADVISDVCFNNHKEIVAQTGFRAVQSTPIRAHGGAIKGVLSTHFAMPHVPSERELRLTDLYLRIAVERISQAQADAALQAARLAAERANEMKTKFLSAAGHDLRQPLQTIGLLKAVLERQVINPQAYTTLIKLGNAAGRMQELVDSLLDANMIESGAVQIEFENLALGPLLARMARDFEPAAGVKGLELRYVQTSSIIQGDRRLLVRVLDNLLSNAIKYTDSGKILIGCRQRGSDILLEVWDTGIGIHPESIDTVFDEFYRGQHEEVERPGRGLGLYIVRRFAELLGYTVEVHSTLGKGSVFSLVIPRQRIVCEDNPDGMPAEAGMGDPCVLLIESDPTQRDALETLLQTEGYRTIAVRDGAAALAELAYISPSAPLVIVTDHAPAGGMDGIGIVQQACRAMRRKIPALVLSGRDPGLMDIDGFGAGCQFIMKPVRPAYLLAAIENAIRLTKPNWRGGAGARQHLASALPMPHAPDAEVAVIDDDAGICDAICAILEPGGYKVESFASADAYLADPQRGRFKCLLVDFGLPGMSGMDLLVQLKAAVDGPQVIILSGNADLSIAVKALQGGAADFLRKPVQGTALLQSIANILRYGQEVPAIDPVQQADVAARLGRLTGREREVLARVIKGELNKNIAADLGISERTTEHHRQNVMRKMGVKSLAKLVQMMSLPR